MKKLVFLLSIWFFGFSLFAGSGISVIAVSNTSAKARTYKDEEGVKVILKSGKYFMVERFLGEKGNYYLFLKNGNKVVFPKSLVEEIKLSIKVDGGEEKIQNKEEEVEHTGKKQLILTDYNVEKHFYPQELKNEETKERKSSGLSVKVLNQVIERKNGMITFKADIKNVTGLEVGKLSIILNIYDNKGKLVEKKKIFLANSLKNGKSVPFTYSLKDPKGVITRFDYAFEGVVYKRPEKEE